MNIMALVIAVIANTALGFMWYSPMLFGKEWMKLMGYTKESMEKAKKEMGPKYAMSMAATFVMAFILSMVINLSINSDNSRPQPALLGTMTPPVIPGITMAFLMWFGFIMPVQMTDVMFGGKTWKLFRINTGYQLVGMLLMGAILGIFGIWR